MKYEYVSTTIYVGMNVTSSAINEKIQDVLNFYSARGYKLSSTMSIDRSGMVNIIFEKEIEEK